MTIEKLIRRPVEALPPTASCAEGAQLMRDARVGSVIVSGDQRRLGIVTALWAIGVFLLAVVQIPTLVLLVPIAVYVFYTSSTIVAVLFLIWVVVVGSSDNVLKPILLGRGVDVPMVVIFVGAIGGFVLNGIIGLFVGAVLLAVGYTLLTAWVAE